jgi:hypothetical protein
MSTYLRQSNNILRWVSLQAMMTRDEGAVNWTKTHNSPFKYSKLMLIDFAHRSKKLDRPLLVLPDITIEPSKHTKYLGMILDQNLNWKEQLMYVQEKGLKWAAHRLVMVRFADILDQVWT